jgi:acetylornithine deacetylase/succinyl-diaminopimelate desuccinylase-like protein
LANLEQQEPMMLEKVLTHIDETLPASLERLFALLRIESISTDPAHRPNVQVAADWLAEELVGIGFDATVRPTDGHPIVVAHDRDDAAGPHLLFYGHYDVQPVDPLEEWRSPPFDPRIDTVDGAAQIFARGASDDKGQLMTFVEACRAWKAVTGSLPVKVSMLFEGEEESGSPSLVQFLTAHAEELKADIALVCDTDMWDRQRPAITVMLRGLVGEEIVVTASDRDLHSGLYGGAGRNPIRVLADILARLHDGDGRVMVPGFYEGVEELPSDVKALWDSLGFDSAGFLDSVGLSVAAGESDRSVLEQVWARPTCEVNGITGGYTGEGFKTVIPSRASAKISFRLVGDQQPDKIRENFRAFVRSHLPADCRVDFSEHGSSPALRLPFEGAYLSHARSALEDEWGAAPALVGSGGSIPVVGDMKRILGLDSLMVGFALDDNRIHSPNEKYDVSSFRGGTRSWARILAALAEHK